jgi:hypothetical protein
MVSDPSFSESDLAQGFCDQKVIELTIEKNSKSLVQITFFFNGLLVFQDPEKRESLENHCRNTSFDGQKLKEKYS